MGMLAAFNMYSQRFWRPIQDLSDKYNILQAAMAACERIFKLMDTKAEIVSPENPRDGRWLQPHRVPPCVVYLSEADAGAEGVQVIARGGEGGYGRSHLVRHLLALKDIEWILKDVSFTVEPGQTMAIVGHTGAGKTTLTSLMMRFYDVTAGQILLDGVDLREQDLTELRQHFAVVLQDPFLFTGTIAENIRLGNGAITDGSWRRRPRRERAGFHREPAERSSRSRCRSGAIRSRRGRSS